VNDLVGVLLVDSHRELVRAWKNVIERGMREEDLRRLCAVPIAEDEVWNLTKRWSDPEVRNTTIAAWTAFAREKYRAFGGDEADRGASILTLVSLGVVLLFAAPYGWTMLQRRRVRRRLGIQH